MDWNEMTTKAPARPPAFLQRMHRGALPVGLALWLCLVAPLMAAPAPGVTSSPTTQASAQPLTAQVATLTTETPNVDGKLMEDCWQRMAPLGDFVNLATGKPAAPRTRVRLAAAKRWLYIAAVCETEDVRQMDAFRRDRDSDVFNDESFEVLLDPAESHRRVYRFAINSRGTRMDEVIPFGGRGVGDGRPCWLGRARFEQKTRWTAEIAIDLAALGLSPKNAGVWRANFIRHACGVTHNDSAWAPARFWVFGCDRERMGTLTGIDCRGLSAGCRLRVAGGNLRPEGNLLRGRLVVEVANELRSRESLEVTLRTPTRWIDTQQIAVGTGAPTTVEFPVEVGVGEEHELKIEAADAATHLPAASTAYVFSIPRPLTAWLDRSYYTDETSAVLRGEIGLGKTDGLALGVRLSNPEAERQVWKATPAVVANSEGVPFRFAASVPLKQLPVGGYLVETILEDLAAARRYRVWNALRRLAPLKGEVKADAGGYLVRDGLPFYPIEVRRLDQPAVPLLNEIKSKAAFNVNWGWYLAYRGMDTYMQGVNKATGCLGDMNIDHLYYTSGPVRDEYLTRLRHLATVPCMFAYGMENLPGEDGYSTEPMATLRNYLQSLDPYHPLYVVLGHPSQAERYRDCADFLVIRCRAIGAGGVGEPEWVYEQVRGARREAGPTVPVVAMLTAYRDYEQGLERPTPIQLRAMTYLAMVGGAAGVIFDGYHYKGRNDLEKRGFSDDPALRETVYLLSRHVALLGPMLLGPDASDALKVAHNGTIRGAARYYAGGIRVIVVNAAPQPAAAAFELGPGNLGAGVRELLENRDVPLEGSRFSVQFGPYETHVFAISPKR